MNIVHLDYTDLLIAGSLVLLNGALSLFLQLRLEKQFLIATFRMIIQLLLVGLVLTKLFGLLSPLWTGLAALVMILFAGREIMARQEHQFVGFWSYGLGTTCMLIAATIITIFALTTQVKPDPWYHPRYGLPLLGMVLGNTMTGISLGLHTLTTQLMQNRQAIEAKLSLGATRKEALLLATRAALRSALMPVINAMAATGLVALPGMMTGQILAGIEPTEAVKYQILIMFLIAGGTGLGSLIAVMGGAYRLTDRRHRLRIDRLKATNKHR